MKKKIAVVILNYNNWQDTLACAESVLASVVKPDWMFIVDNASTNDSVRWIRHWAAGNMDFALGELGARTCASKPLALIELNDSARHAPAFAADVVPYRHFLICSNTNRGYAGGNNLGISAALKLNADAVWILNNDTIVIPGALGAMRDRLFSKPRPGLCGSLLCYMSAPSQIQCRAGGFANKWTGISVLDGFRQEVSEACAENPDEVERRINFIYGASVMASRNFFEKVGLMDERYFLYCEEQDWAYSSNGRFDLTYAPNAVVYHKEGGSTQFSANKFNIHRAWQIVRSRMLLTCKHIPYALPVVCAAMVFCAIRMAWRRTHRLVVSRTQANHILKRFL